MTNEEAIKTLRELWRETNDTWYEEVYNMAIEALSAEAEWIPFTKRLLTDEEKQEYPDWTYIFDCPLPDDAVDMAIEALSAERTGEWIDKGEYAECSMCGAHSGTQFDGVEPIPLKTNYCPNCGVKMKGGAK